MLNQDKFRTAEERANAFHEWCGDRRCDSCVFSEMCGGHDERTVGIDVMAHWLALEAEENPELCPYCNSKCEPMESYTGDFFVRCSKCYYRTGGKPSKAEAIAAHNRMARAVRAAEKEEVK